MEPRQRQLPRVAQAHDALSSRLGLSQRRQEPTAETSHNPSGVAQRKRAFSGRVRLEMNGFHSGWLGHMGAVKAGPSIGIEMALRVTEIRRTRKGVGPNREPAHQIGRNFHY